MLRILLIILTVLFSVDCSKGSSSRKPARIPCTKNSDCSANQVCDSSNKFCHRLRNNGCITTSNCKAAGGNSCTYNPAGIGAGTCKCSQNSDCASIANTICADSGTNQNQCICGSNGPKPRGADTCTAAGAWVCGTTGKVCQKGFSCLSGQCKGRRGFRTKHKYRAATDFSTPESANALCTQEAQQQGLDGAWAALITDESTSAYDNFCVANGYEPLDESLSVTDLRDNPNSGGISILAAQSGDFNDISQWTGAVFTDLPSGDYVFGIGNSGSIYNVPTSNICSNWLSSQGTFSALQNSQINNWSGTDISCSQPASFLCVELD